MEKVYAVTWQPKQATAWHLIHSEFQGNQRGSVMRLLENPIYLSILQNRGQVSAASQLLQDDKTLGHEKRSKLKNLKIVRKFRCTAI